MPRITNPRPVAATGIALLVFGIIVGIRQLGLLQGLELAMYDLHLKFRTVKTAPESPLLLIRVYESDIRQLGYPIDDSSLAKSLNLLSAYGARAIGVDMYRDFPARGRDELRTAVNNTPRVVMIEKRLGEPVPRPDFIQDTGQIGFADLKQDPGGIIRRGLLMMWDDEGRPYLSFALQLALKYLQDFDITLTADPADESLVRLGKTTITRFNGNDGGYQNADDGGYQMLLDYRRGTKPFPSYPLSELLQGKLDKQQVQDRVVILGMTAASVEDRHESPFSTGWGAAGSVYGVEIHAHTVDQLIRNALHGEAPLETLSEQSELFWILAVCFIGAALGVWLQWPWLKVLVAAGGVGLLIATAQDAFSYGLWIPAAPVILAYLGSLALATIYCAQCEHAERKLIMQLFGKFVAPEVATMLWQQRDQFMEEGRPRPQHLTITVMSIDLQGYTTPAENMDPADTLQWINHYLNTMTRIAAEHGGIVDDYAGDGMKVNFGVPIPRKNEQEIKRDAQQAVECALAMGAAINRLNRELAPQHLPPFRLRIGIATGTAIAGNLGSDQRMKYTTVGDVVNTAARLESFNKDSFRDEQGSAFRILISESVYHHLEPEYQITSLGRCELRGKNRAITIYRIWTKNSNEGKTT